MPEIHSIETDYVDYLKGKYSGSKVEIFREAKRHRWVISIIVRCEGEWQDFLLAWYFDLTTREKAEYERGIDTWIANHKQMEVSRCQ